MFKRFATSLSKPPYVVFFLNDSWLRVILYAILIPMLLIIPQTIYKTINPGMTLSRYEQLVYVIEKDLLGQDMKIENGLLVGDLYLETEFDYFTLAVGNNENPSPSILIQLQTEGLIFRIGSQELYRTSYQDLGLINFDFNEQSLDQARLLAIAIQEFYNTQTFVDFFEIVLLYFFRLTDYLIYVILMPFIMMLVSRNQALTISHRIKLSIYLTTIWVFIELILELFNVTGLSFISMLILYIYHIWAYRSIIVIKKGA